MQAEITRQQQYIDAVHGRLKAQGLLPDPDNAFGSPLSQQEVLQSSLAAPAGMGKGTVARRPDAQSDTAAHSKQEPSVLQPLPALELGKGGQQNGTGGSDTVDGPGTPKQVASSASPAKPGGFLCAAQHSFKSSHRLLCCTGDTLWAAKGILKPWLGIASRLGTGDFDAVLLVPF